MFDQNTYQEDVASFKKITPEEVADLIANETLVVIYVGRETCPYCCKFVKKLSHVAAQIDTPIYYVLSSEALYDFRERYDIVTVPGFIVSKKGELAVRCDSSMTEEEILDMIK